VSRDISRLDAFCRACELIPAVYEIADLLDDEERFGIRAQLRRAVVSISANIAEGASRSSSRDYLRFLGIALGSAVEVLHLLEVIRTNALAPAERLERCQNDCSVVVRGLQKLQSTVRAWTKPPGASPRRRR
jgi:four helix bundle protein